MLNRASMVQILQDGTASTSNTKMQRTLNAFKWRQIYVNSPEYCLKLEEGNFLKMKQISNGEMKGLGTGSLVWPAAHVLSKYIEKRYRSSGAMIGKRVCDVGSGTGCAGFAAAVCGAHVTLTDQECILFLLQENKDIVCNDNPFIKPENIRIQRYDWGVNADELDAPFDFVLVSDCVLPKLYPIDILVKAVDAIVGPETIALFSYEHRPFPTYDPRYEFERLAALHNLSVRVIPLKEHHEEYCAEDIELWEVVRQQIIALDDEQEREKNYDQNDISCMNSSSTDVRLSLNSAACVVHTWGSALPVVTVALYGVPVHIQQDAQGHIGTVLWPSSVIVSRYIMEHDLQFFRELAGLPALLETDTGPMVAIDIGAGCGLSSMALAAANYSVISTDNATVLPLLQRNMKNFLQSLIQHRKSATIDVVELDWRKFVKLIEMRNNYSETDAAMKENSEQCGDMVILCDNANEDKCYIPQLCNVAPRLIVCSDCIYNSSVIDTLLTVLEQISTSDTVILLANEMRTSFDEFLHSARRRLGYGFYFKEISLSEPDLQIMRGVSGHVISPPLKLCVMRIVTTSTS